MCACIAIGPLALACARMLQPLPWIEYYDPRYPDHRAVFELCEAGTDSAAAFSRCMQETLTPYPDPAPGATAPDLLRRR